MDDDIVNQCVGTEDKDRPKNPPALCMKIGIGASLTSRRHSHHRFALSCSGHVSSSFVGLTCHRNAQVIWSTCRLAQVDRLRAVLPQVVCVHVTLFDAACLPVYPAGVRPSFGPHMPRRMYPYRPDYPLCAMYVPF